MRTKRLQQTMQKYKDYKRLETIMNNYMAIKWINWENGQIPRKVQFLKTEPRRNRNYGQPNFKH